MIIIQHETNTLNKTKQIIQTKTQNNNTDNNTQ